LLGRPVEAGDHVLVNRDLFYEFAALLSAAKWDVALLQEVPVRWGERLAEATGSEGRISLTARNWMRPVIWPVARSRPHLTGSWEGGCNLILVRKGRPGTEVVKHQRIVLSRLPERRVVSMITTRSGLCVANLHASTGKRAQGDVLKAAAFAVSRAGDQPLVLGGDFNVRPRSSDVFDRLADEFAFSASTGPDAIDHLLVRGAEIMEPAAEWLPGRRDVPDPETGLKVRLSDHSPVTSRIAS
jgi:endonuclease/exonuclease/phosphatase family metal-dependent hydrolase